MNNFKGADMNKKDLPDVQASEDTRGIIIHKVGVTNLVLPIYISMKDDSEDEVSQGTIGNFRITVEVPGNQKGTHMSQLVRTISQRINYEITLDVLRQILNEITNIDELNARKGHIELEFTYFIQMTAPETKSTAPIPVEVTFVVSDYHADRLIVKTPVMSVCPCSMEMCEGKSHNQNCIITIEVETNDWVWIEDLVLVAQNSGSSPVYTVLRRPDEKKVVEYAHYRPCFVEDVIRNVKVLLDKDKRIDWYRIEVESHESIHIHNAYAELEIDPAEAVLNRRRSKGGFEPGLPQDDD